MRRTVIQQETMLSTVSTDSRVPKGHPLRRIKQLEEETRRPNHAVADLTLDVQMLKAVNATKW